MKTLGYAAIAAVVLFSACKTPVYVQKDDSANLNSYKTYSWVETSRGEPGRDVSNQRPAAFADISVRNAANKQFAKLGWREVKTNPDVLVTYDLLVERTTQRQSDPVYSRPFSRMYFNPMTRRWGTVFYPSQFLGYDNYQVPVKEGTITISMVDAQTDKMVWQGWTTESFSGARLPKDDITAAVVNIFSKLDLARR